MFLAGVEGPSGEMQDVHEALALGKAPRRSRCRAPAHEWGRQVHVGDGECPRTGGFGGEAPQGLGFY